MGMYAKVRRLYFRERLSINEIKRQTSLSRNTIKKWLRQGEGVEPKYTRPKAASKITPYESRLQLALQADAHRPKRDRCTALMLFKELQQEVSVQPFHLQISCRLPDTCALWMEAGVSDKEVLWRERIAAWKASCQSLRSFALQISLQLLAQLLGFFPGIAQTDFRINTKGKRLFLACLPITHSPILAPVEINPQIKTISIM